MESGNINELQKKKLNNIQLQLLAPHYFALVSSETNIFLVCNINLSCKKKVEVKKRWWCRNSQLFLQGNFNRRNLIKLSSLFCFLMTSTILLVRKTNWVIMKTIPMKTSFAHLTKKLLNQWASRAWIKDTNVTNDTKGY